MKALLKRRSLYAWCILMIFFVACSKQDELNPQTNLQAEDINNFISQLPAWKTDSITQGEPEFKQDVTVQTDGVPYQCQTYEKNLVRTLQNIISVETNFGVIWPGALIQGNSLENGELQPITVSRSPITIQTDLPLDETFQVIDKPNSVSVQQAIAEFQVASGQMPEGSEAGAGLMNFSVEEAASFKQSMLAMGISGGFTDPESQVGLEASANVSLERSSREHTVIAKFVQEMFTVRLADDLLPTPSDFFASEATLNDLQGLESKGELGAGNIPLYIESVTYGRIMLFTMKSTSVSSAAELSAALNASMQDYVSGGGSLSDEEKEILQNSTTTIFSAGGTKEAANAAIANLNWSEFFKAAPATTAVPISFVAKTLNGKRIVKIVDNVVYEQRDNCQEPYAYEVHINLDKVTLEKGTCIDCSYFSSIREGDQWLADPIASGKITVKGTVVKTFGSGQYAATIADGKLAIASIIRGIWTKTRITEFSYPFSEIETGKTNKRDHVMTESGRSVRFNYSLTKKPLYK